MANQSEHLRNLTSQYLNALQEDIKTIETEETRLTTEVTKVQDLMKDLKLLSESAEWPNSFIQVNSLAYIPANIVHTGEHYVKLGPEIYTLMSLKETLAFLQRKTDRTQKHLDTFSTQRQQLEQRCKFFMETTDELPNTEGMPGEITSGKGTALKTSAGFYEVIEPFLEKEEAFYKKRQQYKSKKKQVAKESNKDDSSYFERLDKLEQQENLRNELEDKEESCNLQGDTSEENSDVFERVRIILQKCDVYKKLQQDDAIQEFCKDSIMKVPEEQLNESVLNELIVAALMNEPERFSINCVIDDFQGQNEKKVEDLSKEEDEDQSKEKDDQCYISSNELAATAFLDSIERDMTNWK